MARRISRVGFGNESYYLLTPQVNCSTSRLWNRSTSTIRITANSCFDCLCYWGPGATRRRASASTRGTILTLARRSAHAEPADRRSDRVGRQLGDTKLIAEAGIRRAVTRGGFVPRPAVGRSGTAGSATTVRRSGIRRRGRAGLIVVSTRLAEAPTSIPLGDRPPQAASTSSPSTTAVTLNDSFLQQQAQRGER